MIIVTTEFIPVGFLPRIAGSLHVSLGLAGLMVVVPGLSAAVSAPLIFTGARQVNRRTMILTLGSLVALSNAVASVAPDFGVVLVGRVLLGVAIAGFSLDRGHPGRTQTGRSARGHPRDLHHRGRRVGLERSSGSPPGRRWETCWAGG